MKKKFLYSFLVVLGLGLCVIGIKQPLVNAQDAEATAPCYANKCYTLVTDKSGVWFFCFTKKGDLNLSTQCKIVKQSKKPTSYSVTYKCGSTTVVVSLKFSTCNVGGKIPCGKATGTIKLKEGTSKILAGSIFLFCSSGSSPEPEHVSIFPGLNSEE